MRAGMPPRSLPRTTYCVDISSGWVPQRDAQWADEYSHYGALQQLTTHGGLFTANMSGLTISSWTPKTVLGRRQRTETWTPFYQLAEASSKPKSWRPLIETKFNKQEMEIYQIFLRATVIQLCALLKKFFKNVLFCSWWWCWRWWWWWWTPLMCSMQTVMSPCGCRPEGALWRSER